MESTPITEVNENPTHCWTFALHGGSDITFVPPSPPNRPSYFHDGVESVWVLLLTDAQVEQLKELFSSIEGLRFECFQQGESTVNTHPAQIGDFVTPACPTCFWADPEVPACCGLLEWDDTVIETALQLHGKPQKDRDLCPLKL